MKGRIPIKALERLSEQYDCPMVVTFSIHANGQVCVTSYGKTKALCRHAADFCTKIVTAVFDGTIQPATTEPTHQPGVPMEWMKKEKA